MIRQAPECQDVHPLAVSEIQVLQTKTAERHGYQSVTAQVHAAPHVHAQQVLVLTNHGQQLFVCDPIRAVVDAEVMENLIVVKHGAERFFGNVRSGLSNARRVNIVTSKTLYIHIRYYHIHQSVWNLRNIIRLIAAGVKSVSPVQGRMCGSWPSTPERVSENSC